ncbi:MAG: hypothetical protein HY270_15130 [Deltaproteobacteria bacterium]|nr:hypothetical protein [Deltaproteobacteria bacterium]
MTKATWAVAVCASLLCTAPHRSLAAADGASLISHAIFDPSIIVSKAPNRSRGQLAAIGGGLVITPTFDSTITSDPDAATIESTINAAIAIYEQKFSDPIAVTINFQEMTTGLGQSSTYYGSIPYTVYLAALSADVTTPDDATALATLSAGPNNPVTGDANMNVMTANLRALGFIANPPPGAFDSTIGLNTSLMNLDRSSINPSKYDLMAVVSHEIDEALGFGSALNGVSNGNPSPTGPVWGEDLFRYDQAGNRSFDTMLATQAFFSIDGVNDLARFNQQAGGDFSDWFSTGPHTPQVQDAFGTAGATPNLGVELQALDVIGYNLASAAFTPTPTSPPTQTPTVTSTPTNTPTSTGTNTPTVTATPTFEGGCAATPISSCRTPGAGSFLLSDNSNNNKDNLSWVWSHGATTTLSEFGDPVNGTSSYRVCVYDESNGVPTLKLGALAPAGGLCHGLTPCWKATGKKTSTGYVYVDRDLTPNGLLRVALKAEVPGKSKAKIVVRGKGPNLPMPAPAGSTLLLQDTNVVVQLVKSDGGVCWESVYPAAAKKSALAVFKDTLP